MSRLFHAWWIVALGLIAMVRCAPERPVAESEAEYRKADSMLWGTYEQEAEQLWTKYADDQTLLAAHADSLFEQTLKENCRLAIRYAHTPSGLKRCFMVRTDLPKDTLRCVLKGLPRKMRRLEAARAIQAHIDTEQIVEGMPYYPFKGVDDCGEELDWSDYAGRYRLLIYGGLGCMGAAGRTELAALRADYSHEQLAILVYWPVDSVDALKQLKERYPSEYRFVSELKSEYAPFKIHYGTQATPTCILIAPDDTVRLKTVGFDPARIRQQLGLMQ